MQISTQSRKRLLFAALFLAILVPLFFTLAIRAQLPLLGFEGGSPLIDWVHQNTTGSGFLRKVTGDATFYSLALLAKDSRLGALLFFQSIACASIALVLLWLTLYCKRSYLAPFTIAYTILSALIFLATMGDYAINSQAEEYCVLMLWGAYLREGRPRLGTRLSDCRRLLFCQPRAQPQGGVRRSPTFPQQRKTARSPAPFFLFRFHISVI